MYNHFNSDVHFFSLLPFLHRCLGQKHQAKKRSVRISISVQINSLTVAASDHKQIHNKSFWHKSYINKCVSKLLPGGETNCDLLFQCIKYFGRKGFTKLNRFLLLLKYNWKVLTKYFPELFSFCYWHLIQLKNWIHILLLWNELELKRNFQREKHEVCLANNINSQKNGNIGS